MNDYQTLIEHYARGGEQLALAIRGLTHDDLLAAPSADDPSVGKWSIQQVVIHVMDSELVSADRLKRMIAEENPNLLGYDENKYTAGLFYDEQSADDAVTIVNLNRQNFARALAKLPAAAFERKGTHNERGPLTVGGYLQAVIDHLNHHVKFIHAKRAAMGKEMW